MNMSLKGKIIAILCEKNYQELEVWYPTLRLREEGATVLLVGTGSAKEYPGKCGYPCKVDTSAEKVNADDIDGVIIPGGYAPDILRMYDSINNLVADVFHQGKVVAAICHGLWVPASAGILKDKKSTCYVAIKDDVIHAGADYVDEECVVDGNLITSRKPDDLPVFMKAVIAALEK